MIILIAKNLFYFLIICWILLTVLFQFTSLRTRITRIIQDNLFYIIPIWKLFAPTPIEKDYHIVYRDYFLDGTLSEFQVYKKKYITILHPRYEKATLTFLLNIMKSITAANNLEEDSINRIYEYKKLKAIMRSYNVDKPIVNRQFAIVDLKYVKDTGQFKLLLSSNILFSN